MFNIALTVSLSFLRWGQWELGLQVDGRAVSTVPHQTRVVSGRIDLLMFSWLIALAWVPL